MKPQDKEALTTTLPAAASMSLRRFQMVFYYFRRVCRRADAGFCFCRRADSPFIGRHGARCQQLRGGLDARIFRFARRCRRGTFACSRVFAAPAASAFMPREPPNNLPPLFTRCRLPPFFATFYNATNGFVSILFFAMQRRRAPRRLIDFSFFFFFFFESSMPAADFSRAGLRRTLTKRRSLPP